VSAPAILISSENSQSYFSFLISRTRPRLLSPQRLLFHIESMPTWPSERLTDLFAELAELTPNHREPRLREIDGKEPALATELRSLLVADSSARDFLGLLRADSQHPAQSERRSRSSDSIDAANSELSPEAQTHLGRYRIRRKLGQGGMATVWLAHDEILERDIALKLLEPAAGGPGAEARRRFIVEGRAAARLDHPHVAIVHDIGEAPDGRLYIAMAYCERGSLAQKLESGPISLEEAISVGWELADALGAAHARGIVHRDLKPANVLFDGAGHARLADFGIAKLAGQDSSFSGSVLGTIAYLAPEQVRGLPADHRVDLWSLGITIYEMLTGVRPFTGESQAAVLHSILATEPRPLREIAAEIPQDLDVLVRRMLAKEPEKRLGSASEARQLLGALSEHGRDGFHQRDLTSRRPARVEMRLAIPAAPTPLLGRERELARAGEALGKARLVTLSGLGGSGKTRLALELARELSDGYRDGGCVVFLAGVARAELVPNAISQALGFRDAEYDPSGANVRRFLAAKELLLVLDNFEHVLGAAPFVAELLDAAPRLTILVTSRNALRLRSEQELPVPPLAVPLAGTSGTSATSEAASVRLFVERARAGRPDFRITDRNSADVAAICRRLDGLPLAIELAAARARILSPRALRARLEVSMDLLRSDAPDVPARHRTMRDVMSWSHELLSHDEQRIFQRLGVFRGGFGLDGAAALCGEGASSTPAIELLDRLTAMCDGSLLVREELPDGEPRFRMLETVREYALERLREAGEERSTRDLHLAYCVSLAEEASEHLRGPAQVTWFARLELEHSNLRAALDHALSSGDLESAMRLGVALRHFWIVTRSEVGAATDRMRELEARLRERGVPDGHPRFASLMLALGLLTGVRSELALSRRYFESALIAYRALGDDLGAAAVLNHLGWSSLQLGDYEQAELSSRAALQAHTLLENEQGVAIAHVNLGWVCLERSELDEAEKSFERALSIQLERGDIRSQAYAKCYIGVVRQRRGNPGEAISLFEECIALVEPLQDRILGPTVISRRAFARHEAGLPGAAAIFEAEVLPPLRTLVFQWSLAAALCSYGTILSDDGAYAAARDALRESLGQFRRMGQRFSTASNVAQLAELARREKDLEESAALWREAILIRQALGDKLSVAECLEGIARLQADAGDVYAAVRLFGGAANLRRQLKAALPPRTNAVQTDILEYCRDRMGETEFESALSEGASLDGSVLEQSALHQLDAFAHASAPQARQAGSALTAPNGSAPTALDA
jgi:non-specific serine/threonine protein kinase